MRCEGDRRGRRYEIRLAGRLGPALRLAFAGLHATVEPRHSVLLVPAGGEDLLDVLAWLRRRQVEEVVQVRSRPRSPLPETTRVGTTRLG